MLWYLFLTLNMQKVTWFCSKKPPRDSNMKAYARSVILLRNQGFLYFFYAWDDIVKVQRLPGQGLWSLVNNLDVLDLIVFIFVE